MAIEMS
ncbi:Protein of unknown function [Bacillus wiedmannii]|jgi:hypothetical protein|nr:Protein of unknown function [Bacillus wiedmannii]